MHLQVKTFFFAGPPIEVCQDDLVVVDVVNKIPGHSVAFHWRGQSLPDAPTMDGTPMVTQCPISSYTTFQYKFKASSPGTHLWHAHAGSETADGIAGAFIVRQPSRLEPQRKLFDVDSKEHVVIVSEWGSELSTSLIPKEDTTRALLINGRDRTNPQVFEVKKGQRYRFRIAYSGRPRGCSMSLSIEKHLIKVIALDGNPIHPYEVNSISLVKGERADVVLKTSQEPGLYAMKIVSDCRVKEVWGLAYIK